MWWSDEQRELWLFKLTVSYESLVADARARKRVKYHDSGGAAGCKTELITVEVGSHGMLGDSDFEALKKAINAPRKEISSLCLLIIQSSILDSLKSPYLYTLYMYMYDVWLPSHIYTSK